MAVHVQDYSLSDAGTFFWALKDKPYLGNVVISPHVYPPSVSFAKAVWPNTGKAKKGQTKMLLGLG